MQTEENVKKRKPNFLIYLILLGVILAGFFYFGQFYGNPTAVTYSQYEKYVEKGELSNISIGQNPQTPTGQVSFTLKGDVYVVNVPDVNAEKERLDESGLEYTFADVEQENLFLSKVLPAIIIALSILLLFTVLMRSRAQGGPPGMQNFTKNRAKRSDPSQNSVKFSNVAGLVEEKEELTEVVDFLKNPQKYIDLGARIPKGMLLVGPPGTGKTLLAKAVAGEAGVPFFTISGSDFVEMFVGVGASRVRDLFADAKASAPCIIFIDEIDAVGRIRGSGMGGSHDEREQTLNQLLVEMDGFSVNEGIIVMAATNRADILDPAILRPGRFDRKVAVGYPDIRGREEILKVHAANKKIGDDVDLKRVAQTTAGFTGADLENLMNEAAISAARDSRLFISMEDIEKSFVKVGIGQEKKSKVISEKEKKITAYHEMGHAILFEALSEVGPVHTVSIIPTGLGAAGYTMPLPEADSMFNTRKKMRQSIMVAMGGRIAEALVFDDITTGASQDIKQANEIARDMVTKYGMSDKIGFMNYEQNQDKVFLGRDIGHVKTYGNDIINAVEAEVKAIIDSCYEEAKAILIEKRGILERGAAALMEKEKLSQEEFEAIYRGEI